MYDLCVGSGTCPGVPGRNVAADGPAVHDPLESEAAQAIVRSKRADEAFAVADIGHGQWVRMNGALRGPFRLSPSPAPLGVRSAGGATGLSGRVRAALALARPNRRPPNGAVLTGKPPPRTALVDLRRLRDVWRQLPLSSAASSSWLMKRARRGAPIFSRLIKAQEWASFAFFSFLPVHKIVHSVQKGKREKGVRLASMNTWGGILLGDDLRSNHIHTAPPHFRARETREREERERERERER